jgi:predicted SPOUT superfamily RNA methylase MTH1
LIFFGGLEGIEGILEQEEHTKKKEDEVESMFDLYLNTCPEQGTRTIRTEEAILVSMAHITSKLRSVGLAIHKN